MLSKAGAGPNPPARTRRGDCGGAGQAQRQAQAGPLGEIGETFRLQTVAAPIDRLHRLHRALHHALQALHEGVIMPPATGHQPAQRFAGHVVQRFGGGLNGEGGQCCKTIKRGAGRKTRQPCMKGVAIE